jgi:xylan 1,4-beta-xylosidase
MSYWVFTDIFEEAGPRTTPFHGGFGLLNYQGIRKPAFYAYQFLHALGNHQLLTNDSSSFTCKDDKGNIQVLFWDFTITHPGDSVNNQQYYIRDLPSRDKGTVAIQLNHVPDGKYLLKTYKTGYKTNDPYTAYVAMGRPGQLTKQQEASLKEISNGKPISVETITITKGAFDRKIPLHENDVILLTLNKAR